MLPKVIPKPSSAPTPAPKPSTSATYAFTDAAVSLSYRAGQSVGSAIGASVSRALDPQERARIVQSVVDIYASRGVIGEDLIEVCSRVYQEALERGLAPREADSEAGNLLEESAARQLADDGVLIPQRARADRSRSPRAPPQAPGQLEATADVRLTGEHTAGGAYTTGVQSLSYSLSADPDGACALPPQRSAVPTDGVSPRPSSLVIRSAPELLPFPFDACGASAVSTGTDGPCRPP